MVKSTKTATKKINPSKHAKAKAVPKKSVTKSNFNFKYLGIGLAILVVALIGSYLVFGSKAAGPQLTWAPPTLVGPTTITLSSSSKNANLDPTKDYIIKLSGKITGYGSVNISGGRNVVLIGGEINHTETGGPGGDPGKDQRGLYIKNWTGTMHIEGVYISGSTLGEGINVDTRSPGAVLQLQNIRVDTVRGSQAGNHADVVQNWGGPTIYRIDRLTGSTTYQGFMVQPIQFSSAMVTKEMDFRNINITGTNTGYKFFRAGGVEKLTFTNVYFQPSSPQAKVGYPESDPVFKQVNFGLAPADFVPAGSVGTGYASPGYIGATTTPPTTTTTPPPPAPTGPVTVISESFTSGTKMQQILGGWKVTNGRYAITSVKNKSSANGNVALYPTTFAGDFTLSANALVIPTNSTFDDYSVIFDYQDANNYYYASFNESNDSGTNGIFKIKNGTMTQLKDFSSVIKAGQDYKIGITKSGTTITVTRDGTTVGSVSDGDFTKGMFGLGSRNNAASFDNLVVTH